MQFLKRGARPFTNITLLPCRRRCRAMARYPLSYVQDCRKMRRISLSMCHLTHFVICVSCCRHATAMSSLGLASAVKDASTCDHPPCSICRPRRCGMPCTGCWQPCRCLAHSSASRQALHRCSQLLFWVKKICRRKPLTWSDRVWQRLHAACPLRNAQRCIMMLSTSAQLLSTWFLAWLSASGAPCLPTKTDLTECTVLAAPHDVWLPMVANSMRTRQFSRRMRHKSVEKTSFNHVAAAILPAAGIAAVAAGWGLQRATGPADHSVTRCKQ